MFAVVRMSMFCQSGRPKSTASIRTRGVVTAAHAPRRAAPVTAGGSEALESLGLLCPGVCSEPHPLFARSVRVDNPPGVSRGHSEQPLRRLM
jgi:hypothetical protein